MRLAGVAGGRVPQSHALEGGQLVRAFDAIEQQGLTALPRTAFELTSWSIGAVGVEATPRCAGRRIRCRAG